MKKNKIYLIFKNNMNSLFCPYYFNSEKSANAYMKSNWFNQKFHIQAVEEMPIISIGEEEIEQ